MKIIIFACLLFASTASAQDISSNAAMKFAYTWMVSGNAVDLWTTKTAFDRGAHEGNGFTTTTNIVPLAASKVSFTLGLALAMRLLETHGYSKAARWIGFVDGSVTFAAALHNRRMMNAPQMRKEMEQ